MPKFMTMSQLQVSFSNPDEAWITLAIDYEARNIIARISYIYESISDLTNILRNILLERGYRISSLIARDKVQFAQSDVSERIYGGVLWMGQPEEYEMNFHSQGDIIRMELYRYPDNRRSINDREHVLSIVEGYEDICLPFWHALRSLRGCLYEQEINAYWIDTTVFVEINKLTKDIRKSIEID